MKIRILFLILVAGLGLFSSMNATPLSGQFNINGSAKIDLTTFDWLPAGGPTGQFRTIDPSSGSFVGLSDLLGTHTGIEKDLTNPPSIVGSAISVPGFLSGFTSPILAPNGLSFSGLIFDLTMIRASSAPVCTGLEAVNVSCSISIAPVALTLKNTGSGTEIDFAVEGYLQFASDATTRTFGTGLYTAQLNGVSIPNTLNQYFNGGIMTSYSANFAATPEPSSVVLLLTGLVLIGCKSYRGQRQE